ncbi:cation transporting ATPase C-terminal domain-containing protein [Caballeronia terrestris]
MPALNPIFKTAPLNVVELTACLLLSGIVFILVEIEKLFRRRGLVYR